MEFLDIRRHGVWTVYGWLHLSWFGISASSVIYKLREFSSNQPSLHLLYFSTYSNIKNSLPYPKHMLRTHYISMSLATLFVSLFVSREPQQIFMDENTECWDNLVKIFAVTLLHIYWVCQCKLFLISEGWERFTDPSKPSLEYHWSDNKCPTAILYLVVLY